MPHIALPDGLPGITSAFAFRPETAVPLRQLEGVGAGRLGLGPFAARDWLAAALAERPSFAPSARRAHAASPWASQSCALAEGAREKRASTRPVRSSFVESSVSKLATE